MSIKRITQWITENGFKFTFKPIEDTISIKETSDGFEIRYLTHDDDPMHPDEYANDDLFLVHYHQDFHITRDKIVVENDVQNWYQGERIEQEMTYWIFPVAAYIHSGVVLSLGEGRHFPNFQWDVSQVGLVFVAKVDYKTKAEAQKIAEALIEDWNAYLAGDVYCLVCEKFDKEKKLIDYDVIGGYSGQEYAKKALLTDI